MKTLTKGVVYLCACVALFGAIYSLGVYIVVHKSCQNVRALWASYSLDKMFNLNITIISCFYKW